jgi:thymidylate kinase
MYFSFKIKGAGKTSALNLVKKQLEENNYDVLTVPEVNNFL